MDNSSKQIFIGHGKEVHHFRPEVTLGKEFHKGENYQKGKGEKGYILLILQYCLIYLWKLGRESLKRISMIPSPKFHSFVY